MHIENVRVTGDRRPIVQCSQEIRTEIIGEPQLSASEHERPIIAATVLVHNSFGSFLRTLECVRHQTRSPDMTIIVDNGSATRVLDELGKRGLEIGPSEFLITMPKNLGVGAGHNLAIEQAKGHGADYVWILEHDTFVYENCLASLETEILQNGELAVVVPTLARNNYEAASLQDDGHRGSKHVKTSIVGHFFTFNGILVSTAFLDTIGPIREDFVVGQEDKDYSYRIDAANGKILVTAYVLGVHPHRGINRFPEVQSPFRVRFEVRSGVIMCREHNPSAMVRILPRTLIRILLDVVSGNPGLAVARTKGIVGGLTYSGQRHKR